MSPSTTDQQSAEEIEEMEAIIDKILAEDARSEKRKFMGSPARRTKALRPLPPHLVSTGGRYTVDPDDYEWPDGAKIHLGDCSECEDCAQEAEFDPNPIQTISEICNELGSSLAGYKTHREAWLRAQVTLNCQGKIAPLHRGPTLRPAKMPETADEAFFSLDRQVLDLHWLFCTHQNLLIGQAEFKYLLSDICFNWGDATDFALSTVKSSIKVSKWLQLDDAAAWEMASLHEDATRKRLFDLRQAEPQIRQQLANVFAGKKNASNLIESDAAHWWVASTIGHMKPTLRARAYALRLGLDVIPQPAIYARQERAAAKRLAAQKARTRAAS